MQETELYQQILGLESPWEVSSIDLDLETSQRGQTNQRGQNKSKEQIKGVRPL